MQLNDLPILQSWADMMTEEANKLDFSLDPRPRLDGREDIELLDAPQHDDNYRVSLVMITMQYGYMTNSPSSERRRIV